LVSHRTERTQAENVGGQGGRTGDNCIMRSFVICTAGHIILGCFNKGMGWFRHVACVAEETMAYIILVGKPKRQGPPPQLFTDLPMTL
jgi:hypothetical protein